MRTVVDTRRIRRRIVLDGILHQLDQGDQAHARMNVPDPSVEEQAEALAGIAEGLVRQVDTHGGPIDSQVKALAQACVLRLEKTATAADAA